MAKPKALLSDFLYVPYHEVDLRALKKHMSVRHYDEKACRRCEHKPDRHSDTCEDCPAYAGLFKFWRKQEIGGKPFIGMATGRDDLIEKIVGPLDRFKMYDKRSDVPFRTGLKFHGKLRDYQKEAVKALLENEHGLLKSAPRTGKTVMGAAIACKVRQRTLIITHQDDLLKQFKHTFYDEELGMTNAQAILDKTGKEPVIIASNPDDFKNRDADVVLSTYQKFISPRGKKLLKRIRKYFGLVIIDECFPAKTMVWLGGKKFAPIEQMYNKGLKVPSMNKDGTIEMKPIYDGFKRPAIEGLLELTMEDGSMFRCTPGHLLWSNDRKCWVEARDIRHDEDIASIVPDMS